jgi:hypothetical protein
MEKSKAIRLAGSQTKLAEILGIAQSAVSQWGDDVPAMRIYQLKVLRPKWFKSEKNRFSIASQQETKQQTI